MTRKSVAPGQRSRLVGEMAGGTAGKCAAVCCCCPCAMVHIVVLAFYTVPKGLFKKAVIKGRRKRQRSLKESTHNNGVVLVQQKRADIDHVMFVGPTPLEEYLAKEPIEAVELENEMWVRFSGTGFWRSDSQREP